MNRPTYNVFFSTTGMGGALKYARSTHEKIASLPWKPQFRLEDIYLEIAPHSGEFPPPPSYSHIVVKCDKIDCTEHVPAEIYHQAERICSHYSDKDQKHKMIGQYVVDSMIDRGLFPFPVETL